MGLIYFFILTCYIANAVCPYLRQQVMGPAQRRAGSTLPIFYNILIIILLSQIQHADFGHKLTDNDIAIALLMGLLDSWSNIVAAFLATQPDLFKIPTHNVRKRIVDESDHVSGNTGTSLLSPAQCAGPSNSPSTGLNSRGKSRFNHYTCTTCGPGGHTDEMCWILHPEM